MKKLTSEQYIEDVLNDYCNIENAATGNMLIRVEEIGIVAKSIWSVLKALNENTEEEQGCEHKYRTGVCGWTICNFCGEKVE